VTEVSGSCQGLGFVVGYPTALSGYLIGCSPPVPVIPTPGIPIIFSGEDPELNRPQLLDRLFDILKNGVFEN
jgi:hypothetical protein